jgi:hypothetical protein
MKRIKMLFPKCTLGLFGLAAVKIVVFDIIKLPFADIVPKPLDPKNIALQFAAAFFLGLFLEHVFSRINRGLVNKTWNIPLFAQRIIALVDVSVLAPLILFITFKFVMSLDVTVSVFFTYPGGTPGGVSITAAGMMALFWAMKWTMNKLKASQWIKWLAIGVLWLGLPVGICLMITFGNSKGALEILMILLLCLAGGLAWGFSMHILLSIASKRQERSHEKDRPKPGFWPED